MGMWDSPTSSYGQHFEAYFQENIKFTHSKSEGYRVQDIKPLGFLILVFYISQVCSHIYVNNNVCVKWFDGKEDSIIQWCLLEKTVSFLIL